MISTEVSTITNPLYYKLKEALDNGLKGKVLAEFMACSTGQVSKLKKKWDLRNYKPKLIPKPKKLPLMETLETLETSDPEVKDTEENKNIGEKDNVDLKITSI